jgi:hypothetical protein
MTPREIVNAVNEFLDRPLSEYMAAADIWGHGLYHYDQCERSWTEFRVISILDQETENND